MFGRGKKKTANKVDLIKRVNDLEREVKANLDKLRHVEIADPERRTEEQKRDHASRLRCRR